MKKFNEIGERLKKLEELLQNKPMERKIIRDIFDIDGESLTLLKSYGEKTKDKTQNIALLVLLGYKEKFEKEKISSADIKKNVVLHGVPLENFGTHLKKLIPQSIIRIGKRGSNKVEYKLTLFGEAKAKKLREDLLKDDE